MPKSQHLITRDDLIPDEDYGQERRARRLSMIPVKKLRRIALGPHATLYFESFETMLQQVQEMLFVEKGGEEQIADELAAYNPLIPKGNELVFTLMFEIDDPMRRLAILRSLGGVEDHMFLQIGDQKTYAATAADDDIDRTTDDGKTSSVHFMRFTLTPEQISAFKDTGTQILAGCDHAEYGHIAMITPASRAELASDFG